MNNIYKNGYLLHAIMGLTIMLYFYDFGLWWGIRAVCIFAILKEIYDIFKKKKIEIENIIDIICTQAGGILGILAEIIKSIFISYL